jgi:hypothetical protein
MDDIFPLRRVSQIFLPGLSWNYDPLDLTLLCSLDDRHTLHCTQMLVETGSGKLFAQTVLEL